MAQNLTYSEVDTAIQNRMNGQEPDSTKRLEAINSEIQNIYAKFDIESGVRDSLFGLIADGQPIIISDYISDFKKVKEFRPASKSGSEFTQIDENILSEHISNNQKINEYSIVYRDGDLFVRANKAGTTIAKQLNGMSDLTANGTWAAEATSDAASLTTTDVRVLDQSESLIFNVDVSQSVNNYAQITNSTMDAVDISDYKDLGRIRFNIYIPNITVLTSIEVLWGSDASNYYSSTATDRVGGDFRLGWNYIDIDWDDATTTGTPDDENIDYLSVKINYEAGYIDSDNFVIEELKMYLPEQMKMLYYTYFAAKNTAGTLIEDLTATSTDVILLPKRFKNLIVTGALKELMPEALGTEAEIPLRRIRKDYEVELNKLDLDIGEAPKVPTKKIKIRPMW